MARSRYLKGDISDYLDKNSGLTAEEREQWREEIKVLNEKARNEKNPEKKKQLQETAWNYFNNMKHWKYLKDNRKKS